MEERGGKRKEGERESERERDDYMHCHSCDINCLFYYSSSPPLPPLFP